MIQLMPGADENFISELEKRMTLVYSVSAYFDRGLSNEEIAKEILGEKIKFDIFDENEISYKCDCTRQRTENALFSLPISDINDMINDGKQIEVCCRFCDKKYVFTIDDLKRIRDNHI
jgi:molecular chaperone Hsp33